MSVAPIDTTAVELTPGLLDLFEHEKPIEQHLEGFADVANALLAIKADRKYRHAGYDTFEDYCQQRWGIGRNYANKLVLGAVTVQTLLRDLPEMGTTVPIPLRERQVRPLAAIPEAEQAEVWAEAVEAADGDQPTARQVEEAVAKRLPLKVPKPTPKATQIATDAGADAPAGDAPASVAPSHPATYPAAVMGIFRDLIPAGSRVLDPFAGVGTIHQLRPDCLTWGVEIEPEWANVGGDCTIVGDSTNLTKIFGDEQFDVIATSPAYGNRLADGYYNASDAESRRTYALDLGRPLTEGSGAGLHFDTNGEYERLHEEVWYQAEQLLRPGGLFILNCKDFQRDGRIMSVTGWHTCVLADLGLVAFDVRTLPAAGLPYTTAKPLSELVVVFRKGHR